MYRVDSALNVFWHPQVPALNYLRYKLAADSCEPWTLRPFPIFGGWAWVARVDSILVFYIRTVGKIIKYAPGNPCSLGSLEEHWLASGFGIIFTYREPDEVSYLQGCIVAGDTFGFLTNVKSPDHSGIPKAYCLVQNYPNPFNPATTVEYWIPYRSFVTLKIYNVLGQEASTLVEGEMEAGRYSAIWNAADKPSGVYFCRLTSVDNTMTIRLMLLR
jgi:hypothetical protein